MTKLKEKTSPSEEVSLAPIVTTEKPLVKEQAVDIDGFIQLRKEFIAKVNAICIEGKDYHVIQGKKSLAKGGAEKIASIFQWQAAFTKDTEALEMLGTPVGLVAFKCTLTKNKKFMGEGRGAASLGKNASDPNKTLKMAQKSAFIDAVLRASGLSDFFTQDLEDMPKEDISQPNPTNHTGVLPSEKQIKLIEDLLYQKRLDEKDLPAKGFDLQTLTGGRDGTASKLITFLKNYIPEQQLVTSAKCNEWIGYIQNSKTDGELDAIEKTLTAQKDQNNFTDDEKIHIQRTLNHQRSMIIADNLKY